MTRNINRDLPPRKKEHGRRGCTARLIDLEAGRTWFCSLRRGHGHDHENTGAKRTWYDPHDLDSIAEWDDPQIALR